MNIFLTEWQRIWIWNALLDSFLWISDDDEEEDIFFTSSWNQWGQTLIYAEVNGTSKKLITLPDASDIDACEYQVVLDETYISLKKLNLILQENFKSQ